ncbi:MAG: Txe/YoeB family addiction module toxin [Bacteroidales bacterium]|nr:Txe/YoeB family addiction module toxin [Bacteroidales bacterium]MCF8343801.1 Txe/YoeB family addiction module toxin [Bacteroidales bacterium]MCF8376750.1 Txe/YoeB family addiction module toxin [Bacteroidales bacterium]
MKKIQDIFKELRIHPRSGTGKPEQLKYELMGYWSRRIDKKNRLIYRIEDKKTVVVIVSASGHYL